MTLDNVCSELTSTSTFKVYSRNKINKQRVDLK